MEKILFINACIREESRTLRLTRHLLKRLDGEIEELNLAAEKIPAIDNWDILQQRFLHVQSNSLDAPELKYARQFATADTIVIAAPYWDLAFPAILKAYMEYVTVTGLTFKYSPEGYPVGLCKAHRLIYAMTAGGPVHFNFGYDYLSALCHNFFGIKETQLFKAENLDIIGSDVEKIMQSALEEIDKRLMVSPSLISSPQHKSDTAIPKT